MLTQSTLAIQPHAWLLPAALQGAGNGLSRIAAGDGAGNQVAQRVAVDVVELAAINASQRPKPISRSPRITGSFPLTSLIMAAIV